jgi:hypothetical protein
VNINAREAIRFFDRAQSGRGKTPVLGVKMQAPTEQYATWAEAEKYLIPEYLPSVDERVLPLAQDIDGTPASKEPEPSGFTYVVDRPVSSPSSSAIVSSASSPKSNRAVLVGVNPEYTSQQKALREANTTTNGHRRGGSTSAAGVPRSIQALLNCVLWRVHKGASSSDGWGSFLLVTNDLETLSWAQKFDISVNRLDQLGQAIRREEADYKSRLSLFERSKSTDRTRDSEADEHPILRSRAPTSPKRGTWLPTGIQDDRSAVHNASSSITVISPNSFSRGVEYKHLDSSDNLIPRGPIDPDSFGRNSYTLIKPRDDFVLKSGTPREASRGKGKLWEP